MIKIIGNKLVVKEVLNTNTKINKLRPILNYGITVTQTKRDLEK